MKRRMMFFVLTCTTLASAHIRLDYPTSRYPIPDEEDSSFLKEGPCGATGDSRTTDASKVTTLVAGSTIEVQFHESVHHDSHYRIAFDLDGQDDFQDPADENDVVDPPVAPVLLDGIMDVSTGEDTYSIQVTLPSVPCEQCTLQVIQYMYGRPDPMYYQCADIVLTAPSTSGGSGAGGSSGSSTGGSSGVPVSPATGGIAEAPASGGSTGEPPMTAGGPGCAHAGAPAYSGFFFPVLAFLVFLRRKRAEVK